MRAGMGGYMSDFEVIIVGGRPAGASLAARLGTYGIRTLVVERTAFPSAPAVSIPFVLSHTMALLDEIGADEAAYAQNTPRMYRFVLEFKDLFRVALPMSEREGRNYLYTVDRSQFDTTLWSRLASYETVEQKERWTMLDVLKEGDRVVGVVVKDEQGRQHKLTASCLVGADGRYSSVARKVGAPVTESRTDVTTAVYFAYWEGVAPYDETGEPLPHIHTSVDGFTYVFMPTSNGRVGVVAQGQFDLYRNLSGTCLEKYLGLLKAHPYVWRRLQNARRVSDLRGIKRMGNLFRQPVGPGWALVGDAYHQKDSIDAQGIYDALIGSKFLAYALNAWLREGQSEEEAMAEYGRKIYGHLKPMFESTMARLSREIYDIPPPFVAKYILRWMLTSEGYGQSFREHIVRNIEPDAWLTPALMVKFLLSGFGRDIGYRLRGGTDPSRMPPVTEFPRQAALDSELQ